MKYNPTPLLAVALLAGFLVLAQYVTAQTAGQTTAPTAAPAWTPPAISLPTPLQHPVIAATPAELARLRQAWKTDGPEHTVLANRFARADAAMKAGLVFPPEGGQHNQFYQCDKCQIALKTIDATHHQCPKCGTIYSGFPYDNVLYAKIHSANVWRAEDAAWAWATTGEKKYAEFAAQILVGYAERYLNYPMVCNNVSDKSIDVGKEKLTKYKTAGHISEQTLGEAMLLVPLSISYDLIYDAGVLTDDQKKQVETKLLRAMAECIDVYRAGKSNWQTWHNAGRFYAGAVLGDEAMVKQALLEPQNGFAFQMGASVLPEGMWFENSWGYHYYTLMAMTHLAEGGRRLGIDLYSHPMLKKMYLVAFDYRMADGSLPRFGDAVQDSLTKVGVNEPAYAAYHDPRLLSSLSDKPTFDSILLGRDTTRPISTDVAGESKIFPGAGHAILRTDGPGKLSAAITFGPYGGFHGHFDKLSFVFFGYGQELGVDPGLAASQAYRLPIHRDWYRATTGHNAILVDGKGQKEADGKLISYNANASYAAVAADAGPAFPNVIHKRLLVLTPTYLLIADELTSTDGKEHTFDWLYHNRGAKMECSLPESQAKLGAGQGYEYLADVKAHAVAKEPFINASVLTENVLTHLTMGAEPGDEVFTATGPVKSVDDRAAAIVVRRKKPNMLMNESGVLFLTVLEPKEKSQASLVQEVGYTIVNETAELRVRRTDGYDLVVVPEFAAFGKDVRVFTRAGTANYREVLGPAPKPAP